MRPGNLLRLMCGVFAATVFLVGCSSSGSEISGSQAPAPGSQEGIRSVTDTDYEQIALTVDTTQVELSNLAMDAETQSNQAVRTVAGEALRVLPPEIEELRKSLVVAGDQVVGHEHHAAVDEESVKKLRELRGNEFNKAWARDMLVLNEQVISAAVNEMNLGEDQATRARARAKIDYASAQNAQLKRILGG